MAFVSYRYTIVQLPEFRKRCNNLLSSYSDFSYYAGTVWYVLSLSIIKQAFCVCVWASFFAQLPKSRNDEWSWQVVNGVAGRAGGQDRTYSSQSQTQSDTEKTFSLALSWDQKRGGRIFSPFTWCCMYEYTVHAKLVVSWSLIRNKNS